MKQATAVHGEQGGPVETGKVLTRAILAVVLLTIGWGCIAVGYRDGLIAPPFVRLTVGLLWISGVGLLIMWVVILWMRSAVSTR